MAIETAVQVPMAPRASDDEILGITSSTIRKSGRAQAGKVAQNGSRSDARATEPLDFFADIPEQGSAPENLDDAGDSSNAAAGEVRGNEDSEALSQILDSNPDLRDAWNDAKAYREAFATPAEAQSATKLLGDLNRMDALFFSKRPEDQVELARAVAQLDPQAFASLAKAMVELSNGPVANGRTAAVMPAERAPATRNVPQNEAPRSADARATESGSASAIPGLTAAQSDFFQATNAQAVQGVMEAIEAQVERLLPEGISKAARNRVAGEIYREMDTTLQGNRALGQQMRDAFKSGALDEAHRRAIVSLVTSRAKQALPAVAKRVLNEWTNTIVSANQDRRARQRNAERRVEISGSGGNDGRRAISSRDVDYRRMSDGDILNL
ncbi:MAG TPA: hypothetical protein VGD60_02720 [Candidatus Acidoferrales bacterium]